MMHEIAACRRRTVGEQVTPGQTDDLGGESWQIRRERRELMQTIRWIESGREEVQWQEDGQWGVREGEDAERG